MKSFAFFLLVVFAAANKADVEEWKQYKTAHKKTYKSLQHESYRRKIFMENLKLIRKHNFEADLNMHTWYMGVNHLSDLTDDEIADTMTGGRVVRKKPENVTVHDFGKFKAPKSKNWVKEGYVNEITDQRSCGSCYAFAAVAALEAAYKKVFGVLYKFSEQEMVDCTYNHQYWMGKYMRTSLKNYGCDGGNTNTCYDYIRYSKGLMLEKDYPYKSKLQKCASNRKKAKRCGIKTVKTFIGVIHSENEIRDAIAYFGPGSSSLFSGASGLGKYRSGIFQVKNCSTKIDHYVNIVGYGREKGKKGGDYWLVRNSWSKQWADHGYIKIARNKNNMCGVCSLVEFPILSK